MTAQSVFQLAKKARPTKPQRIVDTSMIAVEHNTPIPDNVRRNGKYDSMFAQLKVGSCIATERHEAESVACALRKWLKREKIAGMKLLKHSRCNDGKARIWLLKDDSNDE